MSLIKKMLVRVHPDRNRAQNAGEVTAALVELLDRAKRSQGELDELENLLGTAQAEFMESRGERYRNREEYEDEWEEEIDKYRSPEVVQECQEAKMNFADHGVEGQRESVKKHVIATEETLVWWTRELQEADRRIDEEGLGREEDGQWVWNSPGVGEWYEMVKLEYDSACAEAAKAEFHLVELERWLNRVEIANDNKMSREEQMMEWVDDLRSENVQHILTQDPLSNVEKTFLRSIGMIARLSQRSHEQLGKAIRIGPENDSHALQYVLTHAWTYGKEYFRREEALDRAWRDFGLGYKMRREEVDDVGDEVRGRARAIMMEMREYPTAGEQALLTLGPRMRELLGTVTEHAEISHWADRLLKMDLIRKTGKMRLGRPVHVMSRAMRDYQVGKGNWQECLKKEKSRVRGMMYALNKARECRVVLMDETSTAEAKQKAQEWLDKGRRHRRPDTAQRWDADDEDGRHWKTMYGGQVQARGAGRRSAEYRKRRQWRQKLTRAMRDAQWYVDHPNEYREETVQWAWEEVQKIAWQLDQDRREDPNRPSQRGREEERAQYRERGTRGTLDSPASGHSRDSPVRNVHQSDDDGQDRRQWGATEVPVGEDDWADCRQGVGARGSQELVEERGQTAVPAREVIVVDSESDQDGHRQKKTSARGRTNKVTRQVWVPKVQGIWQKQERQVEVPASALEQGMSEMEQLEIRRKERLQEARMRHQEDLAMGKSGMIWKPKADAETASASGVHRPESEAATKEKENEAAEKPVPESWETRRLNANTMAGDLVRAAQQSLTVREDAERIGQNAAMEVTRAPRLNDGPLGDWKGEERFRPHYCRRCKRYLTGEAAYQRHCGSAVHAALYYTETDAVELNGVKVGSPIHSSLLGQLVERRRPLAEEDGKIIRICHALTIGSGWTKEQAEQLVHKHQGEELIAILSAVFAGTRQWPTELMGVSWVQLPKFCRDGWALLLAEDQKRETEQAQAKQVEREELRRGQLSKKVPPGAEGVTDARSEAGRASVPREATGQDAEMLGPEASPPSGGESAEQTVSTPSVGSKRGRSGRNRRSEPKRNVLEGMAEVRRKIHDKLASSNDGCFTTMEEIRQLVDMTSVTKFKVGDVPEETRKECHAREVLTRPACMRAIERERAHDAELRDLVNAARQKLNNEKYQTPRVMIIKQELDEDIRKLEASSAKREKAARERAGRFVTEEAAKHVTKRSKEGGRRILENEGLSENFRIADNLTRREVEAEERRLPEEIEIFLCTPVPSVGMESQIPGTMQTMIDRSKRVRQWLLEQDVESPSAIACMERLKRKPLHQSLLTQARRDEVRAEMIDALEETLVMVENNIRMVPDAYLRLVRMRGACIDEGVDTEPFRAGILSVRRALIRNEGVKEAAVPMPLDLQEAIAGVEATQASASSEAEQVPGKLVKQGPLGPVKVYAEQNPLRALMTGFRLNLRGSRAKRYPDRGYNVVDGERIICVQIMCHRRVEEMIHTLATNPKDMRKPDLAGRTHITIARVKAARDPVTAEFQEKRIQELVRFLDDKMRAMAPWVKFTPSHPMLYFVDTCEEQPTVPFDEDIGQRAHLLEYIRHARKEFKELCNPDMQAVRQPHLALRFSGLFMPLEHGQLRLVGAPWKLGPGVGGAEYWTSADFRGVRTQGRLMMTSLRIQKELDDREKESSAKTSRPSGHAEALMTVVIDEAESVSSRHIGTATDCIETIPSRAVEDVVEFGVVRRLQCRMDWTQLEGVEHPVEWDILLGTGEMAHWHLDRDIVSDPAFWDWASMGCDPEWNEYRVHDEEAMMAGESEVEWHALAAQSMTGSPVGLLDTGCSRAMCGLRAMKSYLRTLSANELLMIRVEESSVLYGFAGGEKQKSFASVRIPVPVLACHMSIEVLDVPTPILISLRQLIEMKAKIDLEQFKIQLTTPSRTVTCPLERSGRGHLTLLLSREREFEDKSATELRTKIEQQLTDFVERVKQAPTPTELKGCAPRKPETTSLVTERAQHLGSGGSVLLAEPEGFQVLKKGKDEMPSGLDGGETPSSNEWYRKLETQRGLEKLHRAMWHPSRTQMEAVLGKMVRQERVSKDKVRRALDWVYQQCSLCRRVRRPLNVPKLGGMVMKAIRPNQWVAMDTTEFYDDMTKLKWKIQIAVDVATRWTLAETVGSSDSRASIGLMALWMQCFGSLPEHVISDNGREYANAPFTEFLSIQGCTKLWTPPYRPQSNGTVERHGGVLKVMIERVLEVMRREFTERLVTFQDIVRISCAAKNSVVGKVGYSSQFLAFGHETNLALREPDCGNLEFEEGITERATAQVQLRRAALDAVVASQQSGFLRRLLEERLQQDVAPVTVGDEVEVLLIDPAKNRGKAFWTGPASVVGTDGRVIWVRLPVGKIVEVHRGQIRVRRAVNMEVVPWSKRAQLKEGPQLEEDREAVSEPSSSEEDEALDPWAQADEEVDPDPPSPVNLPEEPNEKAADKAEMEEEEGSTSDKEAPPIPVLRQQRKSAKPKVRGGRLCRELRDLEEGQKWIPVEKPLAADTGVRTRAQRRREGETAQWTATEVETTSEVFLVSDTIGQQVVYRAKASVSREAAIRKVRRRQRKLENPLMQPSKVARELTPEEIATDAQQVQAAKAKEVKSWQKTGAYRPAAFQKTVHANVLTGRWVLTRKPAAAKPDFSDPVVCPDGSRIKARYVVRGYLEKDLQNTDSPTASRDALMLALSWGVRCGFRVELGDVSTAFLQGEPLERAVQLRPDDFREWGLSPGQIMELIKAVYGLRDAPALWYKAFVKAAKRLGGRVHVLEQGVFRWDWAGAETASAKHGASGPETGPANPQSWTMGMAILHVDDCVFTGDERFFRAMVDEGLRKCFPFGDKEDAARPGGVQYTGTRLIRGETFLVVDQTTYIRNLMIIPVETRRGAKEVLTDDEIAAFRSLLGALQWVVQRTRPDVAYMVARAQEDLQDESVPVTVGDLRDLNNVAKPLWQPLDGALRLLLVTDASWARERENKSQGAYVLFLTEDRSSSSRAGIPAQLVGWRSWRLRRKAIGSLPAEAQALEVATAKAIYLRRVLQWMTGELLPLDVRSDCKSLVENLTKSWTVEDKRVAMQIEKVKEDMQEGVIRDVKHISRDVNYADVMTRLSEPAMIARYRTMMAEGCIQGVE
eukprot:gene173-29_t